MRKYGLVYKFVYNLDYIFMYKPKYYEHIKNIFVLNPGVVIFLRQKNDEWHHIIFICFRMYLGLLLILLSSIVKTIEPKIGIYIDILYNLMIINFKRRFANCIVC